MGSITKQIRNGLNAIMKSRIKQVVVVMYCVLMIILCLYNKKPVSDPFELATVQMTMKYISICFIWLIAGVFLIIQLGMPVDYVMMRQKFQKIGFSNSVNQVPKLIGYEKETDNPNIRLYYFSTKGIPLNEWLECQK